MPLSPVELANFTRQFKKLNPKVQYAVEDQIEFLLHNPNSGEKKTGDLDYIRVRKFKVGGQLYLLAFEADEKEGNLYLYAVGTHQNFYRDVKKYLKA